MAKRACLRLTSLRIRPAVRYGGPGMSKGQGRTVRILHVVALVETVEYQIIGKIKIIMDTLQAHVSVFQVSTKKSLTTYTH